MKKTFFTCAFMCIFGALSVSAQATGGSTVTEKYYGEKANDSRKNPCKGETMSVCYEKTTTLNLLDRLTIGFFDMPSQTVAKTIVQYPDGEVIDEYEEVYDGDLNTVKQQFVQEALINGGEVIVE